MTDSPARPVERPTSAALALNERAWSIADAVVARAAELRVTCTSLPNGARIIDAGIDARGGYGAGQQLVELCMGGLGHVSYQTIHIGQQSYDAVHVWTDHPVVSCMASQYAGWAIKTDGFFGMGSGPLRAHARVEHALFAKLRYAETATRGVLVIETRSHPTEEVAAWIAARAQLEPERLTLAVAPTASIAGCVQVVARVLETGLHKMEVLGFDITRVISGVGSAPIPPVAADDLRAIGRTNDCILYGGQVRFVIDAPDTDLAALAPRLPSESSRDYGSPFSETFKRYGNDFYSIDPLLFSPAEVWLTSASSGATFHAGRRNPDVLNASMSG